MQPTFRVEVALPPDDALEKLRRAIRSPELTGLAESAGPCLDFKIEPEDRRVWSPHLSVQLSDAAEDQATPATELFGRFGPRPDIWTMFMCVYFGAVFVRMVGVTFGYAQWAIGQSPWGLLGAPAGLAVVATLHALSLAGQRLGADQMRRLRSRFDRACQIAFGDGPRGS